jgi:rare lipoprotein A (peptidoglycan hydrolase)
VVPVTSPPYVRDLQNSGERIISPSVLAQALTSLAIVAVLLGLSVLAGLLAAHVRQVNIPANSVWRSATPLTAAALFAELKPPVDTSALAEAVRSSARAQPAPAPAAPPPPPATPAPSSQVGGIQAGAEAVVSNLEPGGCLNLRETPSANGRVLQCLPAGETIRAVAGPQEADGYRWWQVEPGGWLAETYLSPKPATATIIATAPAGTRTQVPTIASGTAQSAARRYIGWATYYGVEDGFRFGDIMYDGTAYNPADPTMTAASFLIPLHSWLLVCTAVRCIVVQVRDRGLLDENGVLLDLSRAAYAQLFSGLGGKQPVTAFVIDPAIVALLPPQAPPAAR